MSEADVAAALLKLQELQRRAHDGIHELLNVLAIWKGEMDLANQAARRVVEGLQRTLEDFYAKYPEFRDAPPP